MLFGTAQFALFLALLLLALSVLPRGVWNGVLLGASLVFYGLWLPAYLPLLLIDIGVNYLFLRQILASPAGGRARKAWLLASLLFSLGLLLWFKYAVFLLEALLPFMAGLGMELQLPEIFLPLGISFYTFQIVALAVDAYRGGEDDDRVRPDHLGQYALYISFFPQLIAGPILRGSEMLPQLRAGAQPTRERNREGAWLLARGLVKKIIFADLLLAPFVDRVFEMPGVANRAYHWTALYAFSFQIYFDFSGYTDMARGIAKWIGFELPENFEEPLLARNPAELWQRWHVTLSRWLRDYLYIPLGGNRLGTSRSYANLMLTMGLGGLWHGAGWTFVLWGLLQGVYLAVHRAFGGRDRAAQPGWRDAWRIFLMFNAWSLGWVLFRAARLDHSVAYAQGLLFDNGLPGVPVFELFLIGLFALLHIGEHVWRSRGDALAQALRQRPWGVYAEALALGVVAAAVVLAGGAGAEFIYFQF